MAKVILIAILAFFYYWIKQKISWEKKQSKGFKKSFMKFTKEKDDQIMLSVIAMFIILIMLPEIVVGIVVYLDIPEGIGLTLIQMVIGFLSGIAGTWIVDKFTAFSKRKLKDKMGA
ncbi:MAG: hypothetical protein K9J21_07085 [Bacteroidales bacterium]|nr:hypothetical protein [Bacteroidales bacterium]